jgi:alkanesulfonate monooxygenase SsuD/methylene tetrahydromethanopterin reductase-like flavin-dependent oxidoreductase (luciferase family)
MKYGIAVPGDADVSLLEEMATAADDLRFDSYLVTDHFMKACVDAWSFLPYLAAKTKKIRLGTCVTPIPFRPPAILAKMVATTDSLSHGRAILGAGLGWHKPEFEGFSQWMETVDRVIATREGLELMIKLWTEEAPVSFEGKFVHSKGAIVDPKPVQKPRPPIWFGSHGPVTLRMTGSFGQGWIPVGPRWAGEFFPPPDAYSQMKNIIEGELKKKSGAKPDEFVFSILINYQDDMDKLKKEIESYTEAGMNYFMLGMSDQNVDCVQKIERVAREICSSL